MRFERSTRELAVFVVASYAGAWLLALPLWLTAFRRESPDQEATPLVQVCLFAMMLVPATVAILLTRRRHRWRELPSVLALAADRPYHRLLARCLRSALVFVLITAGGLVIAELTGSYRAGWPEAWGILPALALSAVLSIPLYLGEEMPAVAAHLGLNEFALVLPRFVAADGEVPDPLFAGPLAVTSWPVLAVAAAIGIAVAVRVRRSSDHSSRLR